MFFLSNQTFSDLIAQENVSEVFPPLIGHHWTHFLVRLNLKKFDRTRKKLIGREKRSIGQENVSEQIEMGQDIRPIRWEKTRLRD